MNEMNVSVIIATYNPNWKKLKRTLDSILNQKYITFEIIISDDGSINNLKEKVCAYFKTINFVHYIFLESEQNQGTVLNFIKGIESASYQWIKMISPGDMLFDNDILYKWISFMNENEAEISFGRSIFYKDCGEILSLSEYPIVKKIYMPYSYSYKKALLDYVFLKDMPNGASFMCRKDIYLAYLNIIKNKIKFGEDAIYRIILADGRKIIYYYHPVIWYEYGDGISTSGNNKWKNIITEERKTCNEIIRNNIIISKNYNFRMRLTLKFLEKIDFVKYIFVPELIFLKFTKIFSKPSLYNDESLNLKLEKILKR